MGTMGTQTQFIRKEAIRWRQHQKLVCFQHDSTDDDNTMHVLRTVVCSQVSDCLKLSAVK